jgi:hypothetical protein
MIFFRMGMLRTVLNTLIGYGFFKDKTIRNAGEYPHGLLLL